MHFRCICIFLPTKHWDENIGVFYRHLYAAWNPRAGFHAAGEGCAGARGPTMQRTSVKIWFRIRLHQRPHCQFLLQTRLRFWCSGLNETFRNCFQLYVSWVRWKRSLWISHLIDRKSKPRIPPPFLWGGMKRPKPLLAGTPTEVFEST